MRNWKLHTFYLSACTLLFIAGLSLRKEETYKPSRAPASVEKSILGSTELVTVGDTELLVLKAKVDSGAETSSLHATNISTFYKDVKGKRTQFVKYKVSDDKGKLIQKESEVQKIDLVKSASGETQRIFILDTITIGDRSYEVEINLVDRTNLSRKFLIGKNLLKKGNFLIDVERDYLLTSAE